MAVVVGRSDTSHIHNSYRINYVHALNSGKKLKSSPKVHFSNTNSTNEKVRSKLLFRCDKYFIKNITANYNTGNT